MEKQKYPSRMKVKAGGLIQVPNKLKALTSNPSATKK
jgi:hypothetical protein